MSNHALDQFQKYLMTHNKSPNTICVYRYAVEQFYHLYPQLTPRNLQLYKVYLLEHYRPQTVNLRIRALNCYMEYRQASITPVSLHPTASAKACSLPRATCWDRSPRLMMNI